MIKLKNSFFKLVKTTKRNINYIKNEDTIKTHSNKMNMFINIRNIREIKKSRRIFGAKHLKTGMLEFCMDPNSSYNKKFFNENFNFIFYFASYWRLALATLTTNNIGLLSSSQLMVNYNKSLKLYNPIEEAT